MLETFLQCLVIIGCPFMFKIEALKADCKVDGICQLISGIKYYFFIEDLKIIYRFIFLVLSIPKRDSHTTDL